MPRLFIGIKITPAKSLEDTFYALRKNLCQSNIKWVDLKNFHLTLKFLGDVEEHYINSLMMLLEQIADRNSQFTLESTGLGYFGKIKQPRVIWIGFKQNSHLKELQTSIEESLTELGFEKEGIYDLPHLTFGRIKNLEKSYCLFQEFRINCIKFFRMEKMAVKTAVIIYLSGSICGWAFCSDCEDYLVWTI